MHVHWEALTAESKELFHLLSDLPFISDFYLGGGTGLALQLGHRLSVDLDFFSDSPEAVGIDQRKAIMEILKGEPSIQIIHDKDGTFVANWKTVGISFFRLNLHPLVKPPSLIKNIRIAAVEEIGAMKLAAILSRGTRKDYVDLYFILRQKSLDDLFKIAAVKYPYHTAFPAFAIRALTYFEDADAEPMPRMIKQVAWEEVKTFLNAQAMAVGRKNLELEKLWDKK
ncbi:MAG: nucleotidyl transferase AbiEii/AbiGii toxin family protein [candidate division KSB1 bacterium]|nr:nucleotidyl transferase AbiEii/AbiGii toxin family protein [candidate division KSB1 bacterium]